MKGPDQCAAPLRLRRIKSLKRKAGFLHKGPNNSSQDIFLALLYISRSYSCFNFPPEEQEEERRKPYQHLQEVKLTGFTVQAEYAAHLSGITYGKQTVFRQASRGKQSYGCVFLA